MQPKHRLVSALTSLQIQLNLGRNQRVEEEPQNQMRSPLNVLIWISDSKFTNAISSTAGRHCWGKKPLKFQCTSCPATNYKHSCTFNRSISGHSLDTEDCMDAEIDEDRISNILNFVFVTVLKCHEMFGNLEVEVLNLLQNK